MHQICVGLMQKKKI